MYYVYYVHLTRLIAREDFIKFTRHKSTKTYTFINNLLAFFFHTQKLYSLQKCEIISTGKKFQSPYNLKMVFKYVL